MISLRLGSVLLLPALGFSCFLNESPNRDGSTGSATASERARAAAQPSSSFMPREPGTSASRSQNVDAGKPGADAAATPPMDASAQASPAARPEAGTLADGQVAMDAAATTAMTTTTTMMTAPPPPRDAQVPHTAPGTRPPTAAGTGAPASMPGQSAPNSNPILPIHRYDFSGSGRVAKDLIGGEDATLQGDAYLDTRGNVQLGQAQDDAVALPNRILAGLSGFTLLGWMDLRTEDCWRRLFDFIYYREAEEGRESAQASALYLTPYACPDSIPRLGYVTQRSQVALDGEDDLGERRQVLLGAAYDAKTGVLQLIVDGVVRAQDDVPIALRELSSARGTLGSPTNAADKRVYGNITEFRIYDRALDAATLTEVARRGPDQL